MGGRWSVVAAGAVAAVLLTGCGGAANGETGTEGSLGFVAGDGSIVLLDPQDRTDAPVAAGPLLSGGELSTADLRGSVVVLNVWASWCAPCRAESPDLQAVWDATRDGGVQFVGINTRDSEAAAAAFVGNYGLTYPHLLDPDGRTQLLFRDSLPPAGDPEHAGPGQAGPRGRPGAGGGFAVAVARPDRAADRRAVRGAGPGADRGAAVTGRERA